jgi:hypothetical protein
MSKYKQTCSVRIGVPGQEDESAHKSKARLAASTPIFEHHRLLTAAISIAGVGIGWAAPMEMG